MRLALMLLLVMACGLPVRNETAPSPMVAKLASFKPKRVDMDRPASVVVVVPMAADTLVTTVAWTLPANDGKGPLDSLKVNLNNINANGALTVKYLPPLATQAVFRQAIPMMDASWTLTAQVCVYRGAGTNAATCTTASSAPFSYTMAAPPPVGGLTVTNVKVP